MQFNQSRPQTCLNSHRCIFSTFKWKILPHSDPVLKKRVPVLTGKCTLCAIVNAGEPARQQTWQAFESCCLWAKRHFSEQMMKMHFKSPTKSALCSRNGSKSKHYIVLKGGSAWLCGRRKCFPPLCFIFSQCWDFWRIQNASISEILVKNS